MRCADGQAMNAKNAKVDATNGKADAMNVRSGATDAEADETNVRLVAMNARAGAMNVTTATNTTVGGWTMCSVMDVNVHFAHYT